VEVGRDASEGAVERMLVARVARVAAVRRGWGCAMGGGCDGGGAGATLSLRILF